MILYKYLPPDRLDVLANRRVRFTQPADFNDPFEFRPRIGAAINTSLTRALLAGEFEQLVNENLAKYGEMFRFISKESLKSLLASQKDRIPDVLRLLDPKLIEMVSPWIDSVFNTTVGVLCLSEVRDSLLMWGHYTDNHHGVVIGFDSESSFFSKRKTDDDEFGFLRQVQYQRERPVVTLTNTSSPVWFQTKSEEWAYEKEWRIARVLSDASSRIEARPHPVCLFEFPADAITEVIIGLRAATMLGKVRSLVAAFPRARLFQAKESPSEYRLIVEPICVSLAAST